MCGGRVSAKLLLRNMPKEAAPKWSSLSAYNNQVKVFFYSAS